jgi:hypothetical protein
MAPVGKGTMGETIKKATLRHNIRTYPGADLYRRGTAQNVRLTVTPADNPRPAPGSKNR